MKLLLNDRACNTMNNREDAVICCCCNLRNNKLLMHNSTNFGCSEPIRGNDGRQISQREFSQLTYRRGIYD